MDKSLEIKNAEILFQEYWRKLDWNNPPIILKGPTFQDAINQCVEYIAHVESCWEQATKLFLLGNYPFSTFFSILTLEETGKLSSLRFELPLLSTDRFSSLKEKRGPSAWFFKHKVKHLMAACSGALVNSRLDRILGVSRVAKFIEDAQAGNIEKLRQSCLYISCDQNETITPFKRVSKEEAKFYAILSGEIMAEVLGVIPPEWERLLKIVSRFEAQLEIRI